jgi:electron transfer flavoprotein beta subunit
MPNMIVCVKQIADPEAPPGSFKVDEAAKQVMPAAGVSQVVSPFDEQAVEAALRIKDAQGGKITVLSLGKNFVMDVIKKPLSMGADEMILLQDPAFEGSDSHTTAYALAMAIKKVGEYDLIFCGRQAADWDAGQVGSGIAEILGIPAITPAKNVELVNGNVKVERVVTDGFEVIEASRGNRSICPAAHHGVKRAWRATVSKAQGNYGSSKEGGAYLECAGYRRRCGKARYRWGTRQGAQAIHPR